MTALAEQFTEVFREEHRGVRDALLDLIGAFEARDQAWAEALLIRAAASVGPHFRYEEEALYPALVEIFGEEYIERLFRDHDGAIGAAARLVELAGKDGLTDGDVAEAKRLLRGILPHVSDCDGLSIMVEVLREDTVRSILAGRERSLAAGLDLLSWAREVRGRPITAPA